MSARRIKSLSMKWLLAFVETVEHQSQVAAADALGCNQSTVSRYLNELEEWFTEPLFSDRARYQLTDSGKRFLHDAKNVIAILSDGRGLKARSELAARMVIEELRNAKAGTPGKRTSSPINQL